MQWPVVGSLPSVALFGSKDFFSYLKSLGKKHGGLFTLKLGDQAAVFITDYNIMKEALVKQGDVFSNRPTLEMTQAMRFVNCPDTGKSLALESLPLFIRPLLGLKDSSLRTGRTGKCSDDLPSKECATLASERNLWKRTSVGERDGSVFGEAVQLHQCHSNGGYQHHFCRALW
jgi:hypothetical protein